MLRGRTFVRGAVDRRSIPQGPRYVLFCLWDGVYTIPLTTNKNT